MPKPGTEPPSAGNFGGGGGGGDARPGDWTCPGCGANVFASKMSCFKCQMPKPEGAPALARSPGPFQAPPALPRIRHIMHHADTRC